VLDDGSVKCWGSGNYGELGYGNTDQVNDPSTVGPVNLGVGRKAVAVDTAAAHTCVILTTGDVMCWGYNYFGTLGVGYNQNVNPMVGDDETPDTVGTLDLGGHKALKVSGGDQNTCALYDDHTVHCWGVGWRGKTGDGMDANEFDAPPATPVDLGTGRTAIDVETAADHTCAVLDNHAVECWGFADDGRLGYGNLNDVGNHETPGAAGPIDLGMGATAVSGGRWHTCAVLDTGDIRCWGWGYLLGYGLDGSGTQNIGDDEAPATAGPVSIGD
jgi:alpha-tubulin suppressor-like RCC1 family protein